MKRPHFVKRAIPLLGLLCAACSLAPAYHRPDVPSPDHFSDHNPFTQAQPADTLAKGNWWEIYGDKTLDRLEQQLGDNQDVKAALSRLQQAQSTLQAQRATLFPTLSVGASSQEIGLSTNRPLYFKGFPKQYRDNLLTADVAYEPDVFGRLSNEVEISKQQMEASRSDLAALQLSIQAELAVDYFTLQAMQQQQKILADLVSNEDQYFQMSKALYTGGAAPEANVAEADVVLQNAKSQEQDAELQMQTLTHAIALLLGQPATGFQLRTDNSDPRPWAGTLLPSQLLERRPDIASAERQMQAANAAIGVAKSAYFPQFSLNAQGGYESSQFANLISVPSELWALGASALVTVFDAGQRAALTEQARQHYEETVANYRETVLNAYREVEDNLSTIRQLNLEHQAQLQAFQSASIAAKQADFDYQGGGGSYLGVVLVQTQVLQAEQQLTVLQSRRMAASVLLVKALGGGYGNTQ
ncbi:MAG: efflux transporter outer membrane subunit [Burkholderiales bacterium]